MEIAQKDRITPTYFAVHSQNSAPGVMVQHFHDEYELFFLVSGAKSCLIDQEIIPVKPNDLILFQPNQIHRLIRDGDFYERHILVISPGFIFSEEENGEITQSFIQAKREGKSLVSLEEHEREILLGYFQEIYEAQHGRQATKEKGVVLETLSYCAQLFRKKAGGVPAAANQAVTHVLQFLNAHYKEADLKLEDIAKSVHLNKNYVCNVFKENTSMTVYRYIINKRIIFAKELLSQGTGVTECAQLSGFGDYSNFIRTFKKLVGISPKQYQREKSFYNRRN